MLSPRVISEPTTAPSATVHDPLLCLPATERAAIALARTQGVTYREVAAALGISDLTAKRRIRSGLLRLRAELARAGVAER